MNANKNGKNGQNGQPKNGGATNGAPMRRRRNNKPKQTNGVLKTLGYVGGAMPLSYAMANVRPIQNQKCRHSGSDFITPITIKADISLPSSRILAEFPITPSAFPGTRLTQFANLYEFYKFVSLRLRYVPAVPVTLACQLVLYVDLDPSDDATSITDSEFLIRQAVAQTGAQQWNFHTPKVIPMAMRADQQFYFTGNDRQNVRFTQQGKAYLIQVTEAVNVSGDPITRDIEAGSIYFDWVVDFNIPQLNPETSFLTATPSQSVSYLAGDISEPWSPSWKPSGNAILSPRTSYFVNLRYKVPNATWVGVPISPIISVIVNGITTGTVTIDGGSTEISHNIVPFIVTTDNDGIPTQDVVVSMGASTASNFLEVGFTLTPLRVGSGFGALAGSTVVE
jgi:hypothetical protein